jgi:tetratricopeptide (TPR) repeat protein
VRLWEDTASRFAKRRIAPARRAELLAALGNALSNAHRDKDGEARLVEAIALARRARSSTLQGRIQLDLGLLLHRRRDLERAKRAYLAALALLEGRGAERLESRAFANLGALHHDERDFTRATSYYERSIAMAAAVGDKRIEGIALTNLAVLAAEEGDAWRAETHLRLALDLLRAATDLRLEGIAHGNLGALSLERGDLARARAELKIAEERLARTGDLRSLGIARVRLSTLAALEGDEAEARAAAAAARASFQGARDPLGLGLVDLALILCDTSTGRLSLDEGRSRLRATMSATVEGRSLEDASDDARGLARIASRAFERLEAGRAPEVDPPAEALVVGPRAETFRAPGATPEYIGDHEAPRRILARLVEERLARPRSCLPVQGLIEAAWPGQSLHPLSAANRAYVALAFLRKHGLAELILRGPEGYLLDPEVPIVAVSRPLAARPRPKAKR